LLFALVVGALFVAVAERIWANLRFTPTPGFRRIAPYVAIALFLVAWIARLAGVDPLPGG
jgi:branched-subunit amino acid ABC-type transport system permease component